MDKIRDDLTILIIDDDKDICELLKVVLNREGFTYVYVAHTAYEGLECVRKFEPNLILLDIMLPDGNGYDLFKHIQSIKETPILFISAKDEEVDRLLGFALGAEDYITKPFSPREVAYRVKARLKNHRPLVDRFDAKPSQDISFGDIRIDTLACEVFKEGSRIDFTAKEYKLLILYVHNPNQNMIKERICEVIFGEEFI